MWIQRFKLVVSNVYYEQRQFKMREIRLFFTLQGAEQEPDPSDRGSYLPGTIQPGGAETAKEQHQQTDWWSLLEPLQDESPVSTKQKTNKSNAKPSKH